MDGQYVIIDLRNMSFIEDEGKNINYYDTEKQAREVCSIHGFKNVWVLELKYNYIDEE